MPKFYDQLHRLESLLADTLTIEQSDGGIITVNGILVDTNQQLEMLAPSFFTTTSDNNQTNNAYKILFKNLGILPANDSEIPLLRDIPLRNQHFKHNPQEDLQFAKFLEDDILPNQWMTIFPEEYNRLRQLIIRSYSQEPEQRKNVTVAPDGTLLKSGGYEAELHTIAGMKLWLHRPDNLTPEQLEVALDKSMGETENTRLIVNYLKPLLLKKDKIAFNIRGVSKTITDRNEDLGGGHQYFMLLDRAQKTLYAINNTRNATDDNLRAFHRQISLFLQSLGDKQSYQFKFLQGKSRQPDNASYLNQVCNISQFIHYAAIASGVKVDDIADVVPPKITTLMYLIQYASTTNNPELSTMLHTLAGTLNDRLRLPLKSEPNPSVVLNLIPIIDTLIANIELQRNGRRTSRNSAEKIDLLTAIKAQITADPEFVNKTQDEYVQAIRTVCATKRNAWHFWATPHSVNEFEALLNTEGNARPLR